MELVTTNRIDLLDLYRHAGSRLATMYLPTPSAVEDAAQQLAIRRKNVERELEASGAEEALVHVAMSALDEVEHSDGPGHLLIVDGAQVVASVPLERPVDKTSVTLSFTPSLLPLLAATQTDVPHLAVLLDRTGADVMLRTGVADPIDQMEVDGPDVRVHRSHPGGWSQKRFQQTAENAWENNASEVVDKIVDDHPDVDLVICGGDERAVGFFVEHLPARIEFHVVDGSRHTDQNAFLDAADVALRSRAAEHLVALMGDWKEHQATGKGATGLDVLTHLTQGRVEHLLVIDDTRETDRPTSPFDFATPAHVDEGVPAAITDGAVALATATGATVTVVPAHPDIDHGLAAILRF